MNASPLALPALRRVACAVALLAVPAWAAADAGQAYVSAQQGGVAVIDLETLKVTRSIDTHGDEPRGIGVTADGRWLVVATRKNGDIEVIERESGRLVRTIKIGKNPEFVRVRGRMAFVSYEPASEGGPPPRTGGKPDDAKKGDAKTDDSTTGDAKAADAKAGDAKKGDAKKGGGKDDDDDSNEPARIAVVDLAAGKVVRTIRAGLETEGIEFSADGRRMLVTNERDSTIGMYEAATGTLLKTVDLKSYGLRPRGIKRSPDGTNYVITLEFANAFVVTDDQANVLRKVDTQQAPYGITYSRGGDRVYVAAARSKVLQVFDTRDWSVVKDVPIGDRCWHFTLTPDDSKLLVTCGRSNEVVVIDAQTLEPVEHIAVQSLPWGVVTYPKAVGSLDWPE